MKGLTYRNTKTTIPNWINTLHIDQPRGFAYESDNHFIHIYSNDKGFYIISIGLTAIEKKKGDLRDWVRNRFGAEDIKELNLEVGHSLDGVWRPSLYFYEDTFQALNVTKLEMRLSEQALRLLVERLDEILLYIEPCEESLSTYSHKNRELLIISCTELENFWKSYFLKTNTPAFNKKTYTTKDYVKLCEKLHLKEFQFSLKSYPAIPNIQPFKTWNSLSPTASINWYDAYNKTKHDRNTHFNQATLINCINAVVANLIIHCVKFSPFPMFEQSNTFSSLINQHFEAQLVNPDFQTFYLPKIELPRDTREDIFIFDPRQN